MITRSSALLASTAATLRVPNCQPFPTPSPPLKMINTDIASDACCDFRHAATFRHRYSGRGHDFLAGNDTDSNSILCLEAERALLFIIQQLRARLHLRWPLVDALISIVHDTIFRQKQRILDFVPLCQIVAGTYMAHYRFQHTAQRRVAGPADYRHFHNEPRLLQSIESLSRYAIASNILYFTLKSFPRPAI